MPRGKPSIKIILGSLFGPIAIASLAYWAMPNDEWKAEEVRKTGMHNLPQYKKNKEFAQSLNKNILTLLDDSKKKD